MGRNPMLQRVFRQTKLFVGQIPWKATEEDLRTLFKHDIVDLYMPRRDGQIKGFAFIKFKDDSVVNQLVEAHKSEKLKLFDKELNLDVSTNIRAKSKPSEQLFIGNLPYEANEDHLKEHFPGAIAIKLMRKISGESMGFAFAKFSSVDEATAAYKEKGGLTLNGRRVVLDYDNKIRS